MGICSWYVNFRHTDQPEGELDQIFNIFWFRMSKRCAFSATFFHQRYSKYFQASELQELNSSPLLPQQETLCNSKPNTDALAPVTLRGHFGLHLQGTKRLHVGSHRILLC